MTTHGPGALARAVACAVLALSPQLRAADPHPASPAAERVQMKLRAIESGRIKPGYAVTFSEAELNAWANDRVPRMFDGIRNQRVQLGSETATASALIDFVKVRQSEGLDTSAVVARLFEGERPVRVVLRVESGAGRAIVSPVSLEISGVAVTGKVLDFLVTRFFVPLFPEAKVGEPFELRDDIERIEIRPRALRVVMKR